MMLVCVSSGAWADDYYISTDTWYSNVSTLNENVVKIKIETPGSLATAINSINQSNYQVVYINITENNSVGLNDADLAALSTLQMKTIDLQDAFYTKDGEKKAFTFSNSTVENLILPDGWAKEEVNAVGTTVGTNLGSCLSIGTYTGLKDVYGADANPNTCASITAYVNKGNTLYTAVRHIFIDNKPNTKVGTAASNYFDCQKIKAVTISGNPVAHDFTAQTAMINLDPDGHVKFSDTYNEATVYNADPRTMAGTAVEPTFNNANLIAYLDLSDAHITEENYQDLTLSRLGILAGSTYRVHLILPTCSDLKTIPAWCCSSNMVKEICIPSNIENICSYAFPSLDHIWTNAAQGDDPATRYDNGIVDATANTINDSEGNMLTGFTDANFGNGTYGGTYTFSSNLKLIQSHAFANSQAHVSDVYVLAVKAPECHVDAFNLKMYVGENTYDPSAIQDGIITRAAYTNSKTSNYWMTMLHYPRECTTPEIQRYTDPTRVYSIATGLKDGKGGTIYFPNQSEYVRAYLQGTYGYVWNAWDPTRDDWGNNSIPSDNPIVGHADAAYSQDGQAIANQLYTDNENTSVDKTDRVFYDTTDGGQLTKPSGQEDYWNVIWEDAQLYPKAETTTATDGAGNVVMVDTEVYQECTDGNFVQNYTFVESEEGEYVKNPVAKGTYSETTSPVEDVDTYYNDNQGTEPVTPKVGNGFYLKDGTKNVYSDVVYAPVEGVKTYYIKDNSGNYTESGIKFNNTPISYNPQTTEKTKYVETNKIVSGVTFYTSNDGSDVEVAEILFNDYYGATIYYKDGDTYKTTNKLIDGVYTYYASWNDGYTYEDATNNLTFTTNVYYKDGTETVTTYDETDYWIPGVTEYYKTWDGGNTYTSVDLTGSGVFTGDYYYVTGTVPAYISAAGQVYDATKVYYTNEEGTMAETITFDKAYYIPDYDYTYAKATEADAGKKLYAKVYDGTYREKNASDASDEPIYCLNTIQVPLQVVTKANDYRGWHQFVLTAYATNSTKEFEPFRSYITDNDWWTICLPYSLTRSEMVKFFGNEKMTAAADRDPYLCRLVYVVRDADEGKIYLNFSKNLLNYTYGEGSDGHFVVTGEVDATADPVVLEAGVPYMIRPNIPADANRQFDIYKATNEDLYTKLNEAQTMTGSAQKALIMNGIYTVPAYEPAESGSITITNPNDSKDEAYKVNLCSGINYSFVGSFYNCLLPQYAYFLGWNPNTERATFYYNREPDLANWRWANETAIIMANWSSATGSGAIHDATSLKDPARWIVTGVAANNDDFTTGSSTGTNLMMTFGNDGVTGIEEIANDMINDNKADNKVYTISGQYVGSNLNGLAKGIYIVNGKKIVVK